MRWEEFREELLKDPKTRYEYDRIGPRFEAVSQLIDARREAGLSQADLAQRMGVTRAVVSRLESVDHSPRLDRLAEAALALGYELEIALRPSEARPERASDVRRAG